MITRNHPTDKPQVRTVFTITLSSGEVVRHTEHYCTSHEIAHGTGFHFWNWDDAAPVCTAFFAREAVVSITCL